MRGSKKPRVALIGTDSMRGKEIKKVLNQKKFPLKDMDFFDPDVEEEYSKLTQFRGEPKVIHHLSKESLSDVDLVFLASDKNVNREFGTLAYKQNFQAIDLSGAFNNEEQIPVVVAGVNDEIIEKEKPSLIANPHPVTVILSLLFHVIFKKFGLLKALAFVLQPVSVFEEPGIKELANQSFSLLSNASLSKKVFKEQIAFNLLSNPEEVDKNGFSSAEKQISLEIRKVLKGYDFPFSLALVQAPVFHAYSIMTYVELKKRAGIKALNILFKESPFFRLTPPTRSSPVSVVGKDKIFIGQIKEEKLFPNGFWIWAVADNLTRGSALNAFEIAKKIFSASSS